MEQRDLYLVIGLNRSGTSALTRALAACGVALDFEQPVYDGVKDHFVAGVEALCTTLSLPFDGDRVSAEFLPAGVDRADGAELLQHPLGRTLQELFDDLRSRAAGMR